MTTITRSSGVVRVNESSQIQLHAGGAVYFAQAVQDYVPPAGTDVFLWIDAGDATASTTRADRTPLQLPGRSPNTAIGGTTPTPTASGFTLDTVSVFATGRQNDRQVLHFDASSTGMTATWGPFAADGSWTIVMFVRVDRPIDDYSTTYIGINRPIVLLTGNGGDLSVVVPSGGSVPAAAVYGADNPTGRIDGVDAGCPWDVPFVGHWRQLCVQNNATTQVRSVYVDGWPVGTSAASTSGVPAATSVTVGGGCPVALAELLVWNRAPLTETDIRQLCDAQRVKWGVVPQLTRVTGGRPSALLALPTALMQTPPPPTPNVWLDSTRGVCVNAAGTVPASAFTRVHRWKDSGSDGNDCTFGTTCRAVYGLGPLERIRSTLPVVMVAAGPGTFRDNPLMQTATTGYTVVCVWRTVATAGGGGGHPLSAARPVSVLGDVQWTERLGTEVACRVTPLPADALLAGSVVVGFWERDPSGQSTWRINALDNAGGYAWTGMVPVTTTPDWTVSSPGRGLHLAQLMIWRRVLTSAERHGLSTWFTTVWGIPLPSPATGNLVPNPIPNAAVPQTASMVMWLDATMGVYASAAPQSPTSVTDGPVAVWSDRTNHQRHVAFPSAQLVENDDGMPLVAITDAGTLPAGKQTPLAGSAGGAFCVVAVWRMATGGHPFNSNGTSVFTGTEWIEYVGSTDRRVLQLPARVTSATLMVAAWSYNGSELTFEVGSLLADAGEKWTKTVSVGTAWSANPITIGSAGRALQLAELLVWPHALTTGERSALDAYLLAKWNPPAPVRPAVLSVLPNPTTVVDFMGITVSPKYVWTVDVLSSLKKSDGTPVASIGDAVYTWEPCNPGVSIDAANTWARLVYNVPSAQVTLQASSANPNRKGLSFPGVWGITRNTVVPHHRRGVVASGRNQSSECTGSRVLPRGALHGEPQRHHRVRQRDHHRSGGRHASVCGGCSEPPVHACGWGWYHVQRHTRPGRRATVHTDLSTCLIPKCTYCSLCSTEQS